MATQLDAARPMVYNAAYRASAGIHEGTNEVQRLVVDTAVIGMDLAC
jgi:alkylation response protein AidB-like acyl-CoA dehydrogenase